jgi:hypothetical protein
MAVEVVLNTASCRAVHAERQSPIHHRLLPSPQVCALKLVEAQLHASLSAARKRSDAATLLSQRLAQQLSASQARLEAVLTLSDLAEAESEAAGLAGASPGSGGGAGLQLAEASARLAAKAAEAHALQEQLLLARQVCAQTAPADEVFEFGSASTLVYPACAHVLLACHTRTRPWYVMLHQTA